MTGSTANTLRQVTYQMNDGTYGKTTYKVTAQLPEGAKYATIEGEYYPNRKGIDFYHHYKEDIGYFGEM